MRVQPRPVDPDQHDVLVHTCRKYGRRNDAGSPKRPPIPSDIEQHVIRCNFGATEVCCLGLGYERKAFGVKLMVQDVLASD